MKDIDTLGDVINTVLTHKPATFESFDDNTLWLSFKFFFSFIKKLGVVLWVKTALQLIPDLLALTRGIPKLVLMIEFTGNSVDEVNDKIIAMQADLEQYHMLYMERDETEAKANKFWLMRRESFNLLRELASERAKFKPAMTEINELVLKSGGSLSGEHNDGMIRGPWLERMYGPSVYGHMKAVKHIFDPENIFNPRKKTDATWDYSFSHIRKNF